MQLVIELPDDFKGYIEDVLMGVGDASGILVDAVMEGIPLPKGHGRLIDADDLYKHVENYGEGIYRLNFIDAYYVRKAPTIIEADKFECDWTIEEK